MAKRILIRQWRIVEPSSGEGLFLWFDPSREAPRLYESEPPKDSGVVDFSEGDDLNGLGVSLQEKLLLSRQRELPF